MSAYLLVEMSCRHEPGEALSDGCEDGMDSLHAVLECAAVLLRPGGFFAFEVGLQADLDPCWQQH